MDSEEKQQEMRRKMKKSVIIETDSESPQPDASSSTRITRFDISLENPRRSPIKFDDIKSDLDKLFAKLRLAYETEETLDKRVHKMTASLEAQRFANRLTHKIYFHLRGCQEKPQSVSSDIKSLSLPGTVEAMEPKVELTTIPSSDELYKAAKNTSNNFLVRFFRRMLKSTDTSKSKEVNSSVTELLKEVSNIPILKETGSLESIILEDDYSKPASPTMTNPSEENTQNLALQGTCTANIPPVANETFDDSSICTRAKSKNVTFECPNCKSEKSNGEEIQVSQPNSSPETPPNPFEGSDNEEEKEEEEVCGAPQSYYEQYIATLAQIKTQTLENKEIQTLVHIETREQNSDEDIFQCKPCRCSNKLSELMECITGVSDLLQGPPRKPETYLVIAVIDRIFKKHPRESKRLLLKHHSASLIKRLSIYLSSELSKKKCNHMDDKLDTDFLAKVITKHLLGIYGSPRKLIKAAILQDSNFCFDFATFVRYELVRRRAYKKKNVFASIFSPVSRAFRSCTHWFYDLLSPSTQVMIDLSCFGGIFTQ